MFSIKFEHITKIYNDGIVALNDVNININAGDFIFITGQSGSGKTTFLNIITKEINPSEGKLYFDDDDVTSISKYNNIAHLRRKMGIIKDKSILLENKTVYKNIELVLEATQKNIVNKKIYIEGLLGVVGMRHKVYVKPFELSGGELSKVELARAVANNPQIIIADEPTSGLDRDDTWDIINLLNEINRKGITVIISTHDKEIVDIMKKRVITLYNGNVIGDSKNGKYGYLV